MTGPLDAAMALGAAMMLAASPVTSECEGRVMLLCHPDGSARKILVWDEEAPLPGPSASKACHACTMEKRQSRHRKKS